MGRGKEISAACLTVLAALIAPACSDGRTHRSASARHQDIPPDQCPDQGTAVDPAEQALNALKNRGTAPTQIDPAITLAAMLADGEDSHRFNSGQAATVSGYVIKVVQGGHPESANCGNLSKRYTDTHIQIGLTPDAPLSQTIVAEVTPKWRAAMAAKGVNWGTKALKSSIVGHRVRFTGWLMFDTRHMGESVNTRAPGMRLWRKTAWEIHPITAMTVDSPR